MWLDIYIFCNVFYLVSTFYLFRPIHLFHYLESSAFCNMYEISFALYKWRNVHVSFVKIRNTLRMRQNLPEYLYFSFRWQVEFWMSQIPRHTYMYVCWLRSFRTSVPLISILSDRVFGVAHTHAMFSIN